MKLVSLNVANTFIHKSPVFAENEDNPPLTPAEMEEYKKLLKDAERIKSIIDANKDALIKEENGIKKYLEENKDKLPIKIKVEEESFIHK